MTRLVPLLLLSGLASLYGQPNRIHGPIDGSRRKVLEQHVHPLAAAANDAGEVDASAEIDHVVLSLAPTAGQQAALDEFLASQQTPGSRTITAGSAPRSTPTGSG